MQTRKLGRTGLDVSVLTFGCGAVGGLMTKGAPADQERAFARALAAGVNHFDTAALYGDGASETNVGHVLKKLKPNIILSTKVRVPAERPNIAAAIASSLEASLKRLQRDHVDVFQLHNTIAAHSDGQTMSVEEVLGDVGPGAEQGARAGKELVLSASPRSARRAALHRLVTSNAFDTAQVPFNAFNPSAGETIPAAYPAQDYGRILDLAAQHGVGTIGIRVLAGGALSGRMERGPLAMQNVEPIGSGSTYAADVARAKRLEMMVHEGHAGSLTEMAMRFAIANEKLSTTEIGLGNLEELEAAIAAIEKGPLSQAALARLKKLQAGFLGEAR